jgi:hypothetical protein
MSVRKIIILSLIIATGCSVSRKRSIIPPAVPVIEEASLFRQLVSSNITTSDFDILKADIEIVSNGSGRKLLGTVKYRTNGEYLISLRHRTGIEAARIFISRDTVMVNDRIYRNLYIGSNDWLIKSYGIGTNLIPLVFGDYHGNMSEAVTIRDCTTGTSEIQGYVGDRELWYFIDCRTGKASSVTISDKTGRNSVNLGFGEYRRSGNILYPGRISIEDQSGNNRIYIVIGSVEFRDTGKLEFIPGNNYEKIILK